MGGNRIVLTMVEGKGCPLFRVGDRMVFDPPEIDVKASTAVCGLVIGKFLQLVGKVGCPGEPAVTRGLMFHCPRTPDPVLFEVETLEESAGPSAVLESLGGNVQKGVAALKTIPIFKPLSASALERVLSMIRLATYSDREVVLQRGELAQGLYVVCRGEVEAFRPPTRETSSVARRLGRRETFGEVSLLTATAVPATYRASGDLVVFFIDRWDFFRILHENPVFAVLMSRRLVSGIVGEEGRRSPEWGKRFAGDLAVLGLAELLRALGESRRTGTLLVTWEEHAGEVGLVDGRVHRVIHGEETGPERLYEMLGWPGGAFSFDPDTVPSPDGPGWSVLELLLEAMRRLDEAEGQVR